MLQQLDDTTPITTSRAAKILDVSEGSVRSYERRGLLSAIRTSTGVRLFDPHDVERLKADRERRHLQTA